ncbi:MAG: hypothetical protein KGM47_07380 [Acidobacteriota bacterium]|nr:hypothetical protein [Acidobacteriota bacterium]
MKRFVIGTALWVAFVAAVTVLGLRWPAVFWLLVLSACLYLIFGRRSNVEFRMGVSHCERERRLYAAVVWKRGAQANSEVADPEFDGMKVEERI